MKRPKSGVRARTTARIRLFAARYCLVPAVLLFAALGFSQTPDPLLQQAEQSLQKKDYAAAAQTLEAYLAKSPDDFRAEFNLAYAYSLSGRRDDAIHHYEHVLVKQPDLILAHLNVGILLVEAGRPADAESHLRAVIDKQPDDFTANFYLAEALAALKRVSEASDAYERVLKIKPSDVRAQLDYGKLLAQTNPAAAEDHLRRAIALDPSLEGVSLDLAALLEGRAAKDSSAWHEVSDIYRSYLAKHPERQDLHVRLGESEAAQNNFASAAEQFEAARTAGDSSLVVAKELLNAYVKSPAPSKEDESKHGVKEIALVREILAQAGNDAEMHLLAGQLHMGRKEYSEAAAEFHRAAGLQPQSADGYRNLAAALYLMGDYPGTVGALTKITELKQDTAGTYFLRAISLDKLHVRKPALENYQKFLALDEKKNPDQEFQARTRSRIIMLEIQKGIGGGR